MWRRDRGPAPLPPPLPPPPPLPLPPPPPLTSPRLLLPLCKRYRLDFKGKGLKPVFHSFIGTRVEVGWFKAMGHNWIQLRVVQPPPLPKEEPMMEAAPSGLGPGGGVGFSARCLPPPPPPPLPLPGPSRGVTIHPTLPPSPPPPPNEARKLLEVAVQDYTKFESTLCNQDIRIQKVQGLKPGAFKLRVNCIQLHSTQLVHSPTSARTCP
jgi:hypothetical protein